MARCTAHLAFGQGSVSEADLEAFQRVRARLFGIAYRTLGRAVDADDVVQDAWLRWQTTDRSQVRDASAFLATVTTRLALNVAESARIRHERSFDPATIDPVDGTADPARDAERRDSLELATSILLERLTAAERAAYVLREGFDYPYRQIADLLALSEANARQLVKRARAHITSGRQRPMSAVIHRYLSEAVVAAARTGDVTQIEQLFASELTPRAPTLVAAARDRPRRKGHSKRTELRWR
jgi:RNA polymerase sigma-70 factor (ECF subfamily)